MKLKDAVKFIQHHERSCYPCGLEHFARVVKRDESTYELTSEIFNIYEDDEVLKVNVVVELEYYGVVDFIVYEFYLDI